MPVCGLGINLILRFSQGSLRELLFIISSLALAGARREGHRRWRSVLFCREQRKSKIIMPKA